MQDRGLSLLLEDGALVGWESGSAGLTTGDGLGVGSRWPTSARRWARCR